MIFRVTFDQYGAVTMMVTAQYWLTRMVTAPIGNRTIRSFIEMRMKSQKALKKNQVTIEKIKITKNKGNT